MIVQKLSILSPYCLLPTASFLEMSNGREIVGSVGRWRDEEVFRDLSYKKVHFC
ncbi:MAG: hypothetical protein F6K39_26135 [Okeania sp. SIO3B3]|nr:hypothetical protein [Okeania sp. SIO3B3]